MLFPERWSSSLWNRRNRQCSRSILTSGLDRAVLKGKWWVTIPGSNSSQNLKCLHKIGQKSAVGMACFFVCTCDSLQDCLLGSMACKSDPKIHPGHSGRCVAHLVRVGLVSPQRLTQRTHGVACWCCCSPIHIRHDDQLLATSLCTATCNIIIRPFHWRNYWPVCMPHILSSCPRHAVETWILGGWAVLQCKDYCHAMKRKWEYNLWCKKNKTRKVTWWDAVGFRYPSDPATAKDYIYATVYRTSTVYLHYKNHLWHGDFGNLSFHTPGGFCFNTLFKVPEASSCTYYWQAHGTVSVNLRLIGFEFSKKRLSLLDKSGDPAWTDPNPENRGGSFKV